MASSSLAQLTSDIEHARQLWDGGERQYAIAWLRGRHDHMMPHHAHRLITDDMTRTKFLSFQTYAAKQQEERLKAHEAKKQQALREDQYLDQALF